MQPLSSKKSFSYSRKLPKTGKWYKSLKVNELWGAAPPRSVSPWYWRSCGNGSWTRLKVAQSWAGRTLLHQVSFRTVLRHRFCSGAIVFLYGLIRFARLEPTIQNRITIIFVGLTVITILDLHIARSNTINFGAMDALLSFGGESAKAASMIFNVLHGVI